MACLDSERHCFASSLLWSCVDDGTGTFRLSHATSVSAHHGARNRCHRHGAGNSRKPFAGSGVREFAVCLGALIGIILAAMSSGYAFGGWASDRYRVAAVLAWLLLGSGAWTLLMSWMGQVAIFKVAKLVEDPRWGPSLAACVLLAPRHSD